jgi:tetratricopeptide (TPR) repeat protein
MSTRILAVKRIFAILILILAVAASYAPAVRNGFVWDDTALVLRDPLIRSWRLIPEGFNHFLFVDATPSDFYRPLQRLSYTIEYAFFAAHPAPYHLTNIALQITAAIALLLFAETLLEAFGYEPTRRRWIAFLAALAWAIHPVNTAAVVYISGRADPLAATFGFAGCYLILRGIARPGEDTRWLMLGAGLSFLCSCLSKETGFIFPVLAIVLLIILKRRRELVQLGVVTLFVGAIYLSLRLPAQHDPAPRLGQAAPLSVRPITMARAVAEYTGLLVFPINLHMERDVRAAFVNNLHSDSAASALRELQTLAGIVITAGVLFLAIRSRRRDLLMFALLVSSILAYLPVSGLIQLNASVAEHWIYIPAAFLFISAALAVYRIVASENRSRAIAGGLTAVIAIWMLFLGSRTFARTFDWKDQRTFLERTIAAGGNSARMLINLGALESSENRLDLAKQHVTQALAKEPEQPFALVELAAISIKRNDFAVAHELLGRAVKIPLVAGQAHELIAILENKEEGLADLRQLRLAARSGSSNWAIEKRYIKVLAETGATATAIRELQRCLQTEWYRAESWQLLGQLLAKTGQTRAAEEAMACANEYDVHLSLRPTAL